MNIKYRILMGNTAVMNKSLQLFENGTVKILMLNSRFNGAGINIPMTTDIIIILEYYSGSSSRTLPV